MDIYQQNYLQELKIYSVLIKIAIKRGQSNLHAIIFSIIKIIWVTEGLVETAANINLTCYFPDLRYLHSRT